MGSLFQRIKTTGDAARLQSKAQNWKQAFLSPLPAFVFYYIGSIGIQFNLSRGTEPALREVIDLMESSLQQRVCVYTCTRSISCLNRVKLNNQEWTEKVKQYAHRGGGAAAAPLGDSLTVHLIRLQTIKAASLG